MASQQAEKLSLVPVNRLPGQSSTDVSEIRAVAGKSLAQPAYEESSTGETPLSGVRLSHRGLANKIAHQAIGGGSRLSRDSLLSGDWLVVDVERRDSELRLFLKAGGVMMSTREHEVVHSVLTGAQDRELSVRMGITRQCVCGHLGNGVMKLGTSSRFSALQAWRVLGEAERGRVGRATIAEVPFGEETLLSLRCDVPPRAEIEVRLSSAETHVAWLVCDGLSNRDIAVERGTAERTVANQVASIFNKLKVCRRFELAQFLLGLR